MLYEIPFEYYPFILIQNTQTPHDSDSYFECCDFDELQNRLDILRTHKVESEDHVYFKYYYISEPYSQIVTDENWMQYLRNTTVTNYILGHPYRVSLFHEEVKKNTANYDIDRLDELFELTKTRFTSALEKEDLAINGYEILFWDMNYDYACGKLTDAGITYLLPMIDHMEVLLGEKKWKHRSFALHILLEQACKGEPKKALSLLKDTVEAFDNYLIAEPEEKLEIHRLLSLAYRWMIDVDADTAFRFWQHAVSEIAKPIESDPEKASWSLLFELIYTPYPEDKKITDAQTEAQISFNTQAQEVEITLGANIAYPLALAYQHLKKHLEWQTIGHVFPDATAIYWTEKSLVYNPDTITRIDLYECAEFFNNIGIQTKRIDFLFKTISLYERVLNARTDYAMEIYYIANLWKQIAEIYIENKEHALADDSIMQAKSFYQKYIAQIKTNTSANLHYARFLEYCYTYEGNIIKPTIAELKSIAEEIEIESEGFHNYPYELLMRIALFEQNEKMAVVECTKSLILHELCVDSAFENLFEEFKNSDFNQLKEFMNETKAFMNEVNANYYYNPKIKWRKVRTMSAEELLEYWNKRKEEIRNRPPNNFQ